MPASGSSAAANSVSILGIKTQVTDAFLGRVGFLLAALIGFAFHRNIFSGFWLDEIYTGAMSCQPSFAAMMPLITFNVHPVLYQILVHLVFSVIGCHLWPIRLISMAAELAGAYILIRHVSRMDANVILATALTIGNPTFWFYAFEARSYGLLFLCGSGVFTYALTDRASDRYKALGFAVFGALLHYFAGFLLVALLAIGVFGDKRPQPGRRFWAFYLTAVILVAAYYGLQLQQSMAADKGLRWIPPLSVFDVFQMFGEVVGSLISLIPMSIAFSLLGTILISARNYISRDGLVLITCFFSFMLLLFALSELKPMFIYRYMHFLMPALVMGLALLTRDARNALTATGLTRLASYSSVMSTLTLVYLLCGFLSLLPRGLPSRAMGWQRAMETMNCSAKRPCGFVLDDLVLPSFSPKQYDLIANFLAKEPGSFIPIEPTEIERWIRQRPGVWILYVKSFRPSVPFGHLIHTLPLVCEDHYRIDNTGAVPCHYVGGTTPPTQK